MLVRSTAQDAGPGKDAAARDTGAVAAVQPGSSLQYQITGKLDLGVDAALFVADLFDASAQDVAALHAQGRTVIAYVSVGSFEPWRDDASSFPPSAIGMPLGAYPDESWLDVRNAAVRQAIAARFDRALSKGFDGVFASTLGAYAQASGFALTSADELQYDLFVAAAAHARGLSVGLSGDFELGPDATDAFDWALTIGCIAGTRCDALAPFQMQHKAVFDLETEGQQDAVCAQAQALGIPVTFKHASFDAWRATCG